MRIRWEASCALALCLITAGATLKAAGDDEIGVREVKMSDPVVVSASRLPSPLSQVGSSVTVITAQDLEHRESGTWARLWFWSRVWMWWFPAAPGN